MKKTTMTALLLTAAFIGSAFAEDTVRVGGQAMYPSKNIVQNAVNSADHTTLVAAVKAAGLVDILSGAGPFTVLAPVNAAFKELPAGTVDNLLKAENKGMLVSILTYHVLPGRLNVAALQRQIKSGKGKASIKTVQGETLTFMMNGDNITVGDAKGNWANITITNVNQSNGVIHVVDQVLMP